MSIHIHLRRLLRSRVFSVTAILVLGLGLGVHMVLFNTVYALLWRPLNFPEHARLVTVAERSPAGDLSRSISGQQAWTLRQQTSVIQDVGLRSSGGLATLLRGDEAMDLPSAQVNSGYFKALGLRPVVGRFFGEEEDRGENAEQRAVLTEATWRTQFGSDHSVVGRVFSIQQGTARRPIRVIGVAPGAATLPFASDAGILLPIPWANGLVRTNSGNAVYSTVLRLQPGVSLSQASARIEAAIRNAERETRIGAGGHCWVEPLRAALEPAHRGTILFFYGSACLLLVLTCANLASLFVARAMARAHETSVHMALGATRWRLRWTEFQEALLVCTAGAGFAFLVERWLRPLVPKLLPAVKAVGPELLETGPVLLAFGILMCLGVSAIVSVASGLRTQEAGLAAALAQGGRSGISASGRLRAGLVAAQLAIVLTLLTLAGMAARSFLAAMRSAPGLDPRGVITFQASVAGSRLPGLPVAVELADRIAAVPGVRSVGFAAELPVGKTPFLARIGARPGPVMPDDPMIALRLIGRSYFETLGARFAGGRPFSEGELQQARPVVILNQAASRVLFHGEEPTGRTLQAPFLPYRSQVVGVVQDIRTEGLDQPPAPMIYLPYQPFFGSLTFMVWTGSDPAAFLPLLKSRLRAENSGVVLRQVKPLEDLLDDSVRERMLAGALLGGFALLGLIVSSVGLYGTLAAHVQQRRRELGVRIALGATARVVVATVLGEGMRIVFAGALAGLAASAMAARLIRAELYAVGPLDPASFSVALLLLSAAAVCACLIPAVKASRVDPIQALNAQ